MLGKKKKIPSPSLSWFSKPRCQISAFMWFIWTFYHILHFSFFPDISILVKLVSPPGEAALYIWHSLFPSVLAWGNELCTKVKMQNIIDFIMCKLCPNSLLIPLHPKNLSFFCAFLALTEDGHLSLGFPEWY